MIVPSTHSQQLLDELLGILINYAGKEGDNEGAVETLNRIIKERDSNHRLFDAAFRALTKLDSVRFAWNVPIKQAAEILREATGPQT